MSAGDECPVPVVIVVIDCRVNTRARIASAVESCITQHSPQHVRIGADDLRGVHIRLLSCFSEHQ